MSGSPLGSCGLAGPTEAIMAAAVTSAMAREAGVLRRSLLSPRPFVMTGRIPREFRRKLERRRDVVNEAAITTWECAEKPAECGDNEAMRQMTQSDRSRSCSMRRNG